MKRSHMIAAGIGMVALLATAGAGAYFGRDTLMAEDVVAKSDPVPATKSQNSITWNQPAPVKAQATAPVQTASNCDDGNVLGLVLGGAAGGIAGSQIGSGSGKTAATIGGALGGAYLGGEYIPLKNATCR